MSWVWCQRNGGWYLGGQKVAAGYSGFGRGKNNPDCQTEHGIGPIPCGSWTIDGPPFSTDTHGPFVLRLLPKVGTQTWGRSSFLIHGDSRIHPGEASQGCIVLPEEIRMALWASGDYDLEVVAEPVQAEGSTPPMGIPLPGDLT